MRSILPARQLSPADAASLIDEYWVAPATSILEEWGSTHLSSYLILIFPCPIFFLSLLFLPSCSWNLSQWRQKFLRSNNCSNFPAVMTVGVLLSWFFLLFFFPLAVFPNEKVAEDHVPRCYLLRLRFFFLVFDIHSSVVQQAWSTTA